MRAIFQIILGASAAHAFRATTPVSSFRKQYTPRLVTIERTISGNTSLDAALYPVSGVDDLPVIQQQLIFLSAFAGLGVGTTSLSTVFNSVGGKFSDGLFNKWKSTWPILGLVYMAAGTAHFTVADAFVSIFPPIGTWGLWYLPGSPEFHVAWTGIAEFAGGTGLLAGAIGAALSSEDGPWGILKRISAGSLAALTVAVSPANFYMYSHGAIMVGAGPDGPVGLEFHAVRFVLQIILLSILVGIATDQDQGDGKVSSMMQKE
uniref:Uncharacterized protein n=1 Tax=Corethron hystrix TaxID=216773 RepID=A0A7S1C0Q3_9STRA|mmetsp:Transcript_7944/g.17235  ORF Transcript_7944/g.17235 Transcript_7944/m.17235 type:complete len:262 (+) Transcript_7944:112-897(+)